MWILVKNFQSKRLGTALSGVILSVILAAQYKKIADETDVFALRHIGIREENLEHMFKTVGVSNLEELISETIPDEIRLKEKLPLSEPMSEHAFLKHIEALGKDNKVYTSYIGLGYHESLTPSVIKRNILENPGWYTAYTPYQAEIAQGRLEHC